MIRFTDKTGATRFEASGCGGCLIVGAAILIILAIVSAILPS